MQAVFDGPKECLLNTTIRAPDSQSVLFRTETISKANSRDTRLYSSENVLLGKIMWEPTPVQMEINARSLRCDRMKRPFEPQSASTDVLWTWDKYTQYRIKTNMFSPTIEAFDNTIGGDGLAAREYPAAMFTPCKKPVLGLFGKETPAKLEISAHVIGADALPIAPKKSSKYGLVVPGRENVVYIILVILYTQAMKDEKAAMKKMKKNEKKNTLPAATPPPTVTSTSSALTTSTLDTDAGTTNSTIPV